MDKNFDWDGFKRSKFVVHVKTQEEYDELIEACKEHGINFYYSFGESLGEPNFFKIYKENTCIRANGTITYCEYDWYAKNDIKIVEFDQKNEPAPAPTETSSNENILHLDDSTLLDICQEGLDKIGKIALDDYPNEFITGYIKAVSDVIKQLKGGDTK